MEGNLLGYAICAGSAYLKLKFLKCWSPYVICLNQTVEHFWLLKFNHIQRVGRLNMTFLLKGKWDIICICSFKWEKFFYSLLCMGFDRPYCLNLSLSLLLMVLCFLVVLKCEILVHVQCSLVNHSFLWQFTISIFCLH